MHLSVALALVAASSLLSLAPDPTDPSPDLLPEEVVRIQVEALQHNDEPTPDAGVEAAFRFASPDNRAATGPVERFARMVKGPVYGDMIGFEQAEFGLVEVEGDRAVQRVTLAHADGRRVTYAFVLSRQRGGPYDGCWMTDGVVREAEPSQRGVRRV